MFGAWSPNNAELNDCGFVVEQRSLQSAYMRQNLFTIELCTTGKGETGLTSHLVYTQLEGQETVPAPPCGIKQLPLNEERTFTKYPQPSSIQYRLANKQGDPSHVRNCINSIFLFSIKTLNRKFSPKWCKLKRNRLKAKIIKCINTT